MPPSAAQLTLSCSEQASLLDLARERSGIKREIDQLSDSEDSQQVKFLLERRLKVLAKRMKAAPVGDDDLAEEEHGKDGSGNKDADSTVQSGATQH